MGALLSKVSKFRNECSDAQLPRTHCHDLPPEVWAEVIQFTAPELRTPLRRVSRAFRHEIDRQAAHLTVRSNAALRAIAANPTFLSLQRLTLRFNQYPDFSRWSSRIRTIDLKNGLPLSPEQLATLHHLPLETLRLRTARIGDKGCIAISGIVSLRTLDLAYTSITAAGIPALVTLPRLTALYLDGNAIGSLGAIALAEHPGLTTLSLRKAGVMDTGVCALARRSHVTELNLANNPFRVLSILPLAQSSRLRTLHIGENDLGDYAASVFARNRTLTDLRINEGEVTDRGAALLAFHPVLQTLDVSGNRLTATGIAALRSNARLTHLRVHEDPGCLSRRLAKASLVTPRFTLFRFVRAR